jgi:hypothetical protein
MMTGIIGEFGDKAETGKFMQQNIILLKSFDFAVKISNLYLDLTEFIALNDELIRILTAIVKTSQTNKNTHLNH